MLLSWPNTKWKTISLIIFFIPCIWRFTRANIFLGDISFAFLRIRPWLELMFRISFYPWILRESAPNDLDVASDGKLCTFTRRMLNIIRANNKNRTFFARLIHLDRLHNLFFSSFLPLFYSRRLVATSVNSGNWMLIILILLSSSTSPTSKRAAE